MPESETTTTTPAVVASQSQDQPQNPPPASSEMAETEESQQQEQPKPETEESQQQEQPKPENLAHKFDKMNISNSFSIWPPTQRTRDAVINRLIETLTTPSVLSKRYGSLPQDEASATARDIEEEAFNAAASAAGGSGDAAPSIDDGIEILQVYSKEISKRMLEAVKSRAANATPEVTSAQTVPEAPASSATVASEEVPSVDNESSA